MLFEDDSASECETRVPKIIFLLYIFKIDKKISEQEKVFFVIRSVDLFVYAKIRAEIIMFFLGFSE